MRLGMKRGIVFLEAHHSGWEKAAEKTIDMLRSILGDAAADIQHVGSTSVRQIQAKPIIDIAVAATDFDEVLSKNKELEQHGVIFRLDERPERLLYVTGDFEKDTRSHHIHVVSTGSKEWNNYIDFRDYLNHHESAARRYEAEKLRLARLFPYDRGAYTEGKAPLIDMLLSEAAAWRKTVSRQQ